MPFFLTEAACDKQAAFLWLINYFCAPKHHTMQIKYILLFVAILAFTSAQAQTDDPASSKDEHVPKPKYSYRQFIKDNMRYPENARKNNIEGRVVVKFCVNEDGAISNVTVVRSVYSELDSEAARMVRKMPPWEPAKENGVPVKAFLELPVQFKLKPEKEKEPTDSAQKKIFMYVEQMPQAPYDYQQYLAQNIHYPDSAQAHNIEGRVIIRFIVNEDGKISDCVVWKSVDDDIDAEALRVVKSFPPWRPGKQNGKYVKVYFTLPIVFKLED